MRSYPQLCSCRGEQAAELAMINCWQNWQAMDDEMHGTAELSKVWSFDDLQAHLASLPGDVVWRRYEIVDGVLVVSPAASLLHEFVCIDVAHRLKLTAPADVAVLGAVAIDLAPSYRVPDVVVLRREALYERSLLVHPTEILLGVEVVSPSSRTTDRITKPAQYAAAGIPNYWRIELDPELSLTAYTLAEGAGVYAELGTWRAGEVAQLREPFPVDIPIDELVPLP